MSISYRKKKKNDLETFIRMRIAQLAGWGENGRNQWDVFCGETAVFQLPDRTDRFTVKHVYRSRLSPSGNRKGTAEACSRRSTGI